MVKNNQNVYDLFKNGEYQEALLISEQEYNNNSESITSLYDYVSLLIRFKLYDKAQEVLLDCSFSIEGNNNIYDLYEELYCRWPDNDKLKKLRDKYFPGLIENKTIIDISSEKGELRPDKRYFKNQLHDLLKFLLDNYREDEKILKKIIVLIRYDNLSNGYYLLKKFALETEKKVLGYFILAELSLVEKKINIAKKRYKKLLGQFEPEWLIYNRLGDIALSEGDIEKAEHNYIKANELNPDDFDTITDLIRTYTLNGDIKKAKTSYNNAVNKFGKEKLLYLRPYINKRTKRKYKGTIINGLVWHENGGSLLPIEILGKPDNHININPTGNLGIDLLDSIHLALSVAKDNNYWTTSPEALCKSIHINISEAIRHKDGPSAGLPFVIGIMAELMSNKIPTDCAFTGELSLQGRILPVGGIKEKVTAAYINGIKTVYLPKDNFYDTSILNPQIKGGLQINLVEHYEDVIENLWKN